MKESIRLKLESVQDRFEEIAGLLADPDVIADQNQFRDLSKEYARVEPVVQNFQQYRSVLDDIAAAEEMAGDADEEVRAMGQEELEGLNERREALLEQLQKSLIPPDPYDESNVYLEVRAGTGGDEAAIFAGDLFRMYSKYAETMGWNIEILSAREGEHGGYKEIISRITGSSIYAKLKFESGAHRVQRVPATESQGRIHTSACTVAVLPEPDEVEAVEINPADLRVDTYRASGAGGQHVNKTDSAVRITHEPTGIVVSCQAERSQMQNKARAMQLLAARLAERARQEQMETVAAIRGEQTEAGWGRQIRSYVLQPYQMVKDLRTEFEVGNIQGVLDGDIDGLVDSYLHWRRAENNAS